MTNKAEVGIITFHCSDNYGAMLQAYGLKTYLRSNGVNTDIVRYEPCFMTGRHWWIPYIPIGGFRECFRNAKREWKWHLRMKKDFFKLRYNMRTFRKRYLIESKSRKILFLYQFQRLSYQYYIVGSDQIWNPDITFGLREAYFGAFDSGKKKEVIAYAASMGRESLANEYDKKFSELVIHVDEVAVREMAAIPYIKRFYKGNVRAVLDPVFLLEKEEWIRIEKMPEREKNILVYVTEPNKELADYAIKLSQEKHLPVVELRLNAGKAHPDFGADYTAGPSEFLGYIHQAEYVVTNSFHAVAFSIIYQKRFLVFTHSTVNARLHNILHIHGLEDRLWQDGKEGQIDSRVDWEKVKNKTEENIRLSSAYLMKHLPQK